MLHFHYHSVQGHCSFIQFWCVWAHGSAGKSNSISPDVDLTWSWMNLGWNLNIPPSTCNKSGNRTDRHHDAADAALDSCYVCKFGGLPFYVLLVVGGENKHNFVLTGHENFFQTKMTAEEFCWFWRVFYGCHPLKLGCGHWRFNSFQFMPHLSLASTSSSTSLHLRVTDSFGPDNSFPMKQLPLRT